MISHFPGRCKGCNEPYAKGTEIYWTREDGGWCWDCRDNPQPTAECHRIADELGFAPYGAPIEWSRIPTRGQVLLLFNGSSGDSAGRTRTASHGQQASLWPMRAS